MPIRIIKYLLIYFLITSTFPVEAQDDSRQTKYQVYSIYIYNFAKYIQWPETYNNNEFIIGLLGNSPLEKEIDKLSKVQQVNGRKIKVVKYDNPQDIEKNCNIVYIPKDESHLLSDVLKITKGTSTVVVTNKEGLGKTGSLINFTQKNDAPTFEINLSAFKSRQLSLAQQLKSIGIVI